MMKNKFLLGLGLAAMIATFGVIRWYLTISNPLAPLNISHSSRPTPPATPSLIPTEVPTASMSQEPTPTPTPAPTIIPGARPTDWNTYRNYEWQFEMKIPPNWKAEQVGYGLVISGDNAAIRIDTDGVGPDGPGELTITTRTVAGQQVEVADGTFFSLKRNNADIPYYWFRINNWTDTVDRILSSFHSPLSQVTPKPKSPTLPVSVPSGWKTWSDTTYDYQISYPSTFYLRGSGDDLHITNVDTTVGAHTGSEPTDTTIRVLFYPDVSSLAAWSHDFDFLESTTTTLAGETAVRGKTKDDQLPNFNGDILVVHNARGFQLDYSPYDSQYRATIEQIIATFRFIE